MHAGAVRCGSSWDDASGHCNNDCITDADCTGGLKCYDELPMTACTGGVIDVTSAIRCGSTWIVADATCGVSCPSAQDGECPQGERCYKDLSPCNPVSTTTTTISSTTTTISPTTTTISSTTLPTSPYIPPASPMGNCQPQDFILFIDGSISVDDLEFSQMIAMITVLIESFPANARVAAMAFSVDDLTLLDDYWITDFTSPSDAANILENWIRPQAHYTFVATGLQYLLENSPIQWDLHTDRKRELLIFCDGVANDKVRLPEMKQQLDARMIKTTVVGITSGFEKDLNVLVDDPEKDIIEAPSFTELTEVQVALEGMACIPNASSANVNVDIEGDDINVHHDIHVQTPEVNVEGDDIDVHTPAVNVQHDIQVQSPEIYVEQPSIYVTPSNHDVIIKQSLISVPSTEVFVLYILILLILFVCCFAWVLLGCFCMRDHLKCVCWKRKNKKLEELCLTGDESDLEEGSTIGFRSYAPPKKSGSFLGQLEQVVCLKTSDKKKIEVKCNGFTVNNEMDNRVRAALMRCAALHAETQHHFHFDQLEVTKLPKSNEYQFGNWHRKTYVRECSGRLFARVGGGWEELHEFIGRIVERSASVGKFNEAEKLADKGEKIANGARQDSPAPKEMGTFEKGVLTVGDTAPEGILVRSSKSKMGKTASCDTSSDCGSEGRKTRVPPASQTPVE